MAKYSLDPIAANCYPDTAVLVNKLGIRDDEKLLQAEMNITQVAAASWDRSPLSSSFDFEHYKAIHRHLFQEIYDWAGLTRDVDISKKGVKFCPNIEIESYAGRVFDRLRNTGFLSGQPKNKFVPEFIDLYIATNYLHPFREGNGRTQRLFLAQLARSAGFELNYADIDVDELMIVTIQSAHGMSDGLARVFEAAIT